MQLLAEYEEDHRGFVAGEPRLSTTKRRTMCCWADRRLECIAFGRNEMRVKDVNRTLLLFLSWAGVQDVPKAVASPTVVGGQDSRPHSSFPMMRFKRIQRRV